MKFIEDPNVKNMAIQKLLFNPLERTFTIAGAKGPFTTGELVNAIIIDGMPKNRDMVNLR